MPILPLTPDELLTTTRAVRKRLDFSRPVEREVIEECLTIAQQAPSGSNAQNWHFVVVTDPGKRAAIGELYRRGRDLYYSGAGGMRRPTFDDPERGAIDARVRSSSAYLAERMGDAPVLVIPCIAGRTDDQPIVTQASRWWSIVPASWSFMLAARARGLGTVSTTLHLFFEKEAAEVLGIPFAEVMQAGLIPVAYTRGTDFKPASRDPLDRVTHWDEW